MIHIIYVFQYYSNQASVQEIACELGLFIDEKIPDRQHVILAHSMGGLVAKAYMIFYPHKNGEWAGMKGGETVLGAITLATPHHGTHGSNDVNALRQYIKFGWKQVIDKLNFAYWSDRAGFFSPQSLASGMPNRGDLRWDNYDKAIPANSLTNNDVNIWLPTANRKFEQFASKVILYAGALRLENFSNSPQSALDIIKEKSIDAHQQASFANYILVNGFSNKFGSTDGLVPYKSALLCDESLNSWSSNKPNFICNSKYKVRRFEAGQWDAIPNERPDANTLSTKRIRRGYDHKDMYEHPDVLSYVVSDLKDFVENINPNPKNPEFPPKLFPIVENKKYGYINSTGNIIVSPQFEHASDFYEGMGRIQVRGLKFGFVNATGNLVIKPQFDDADDFHEGLARVTVKNKSGFIDLDGNYIIPLIIGEGPRALPWGVMNFADGLAFLLSFDRESGFIDRTNSLVIESPFKYRNYDVYLSSEGFSEGLCSANFYNKDGSFKIGYVNKIGRVIIEPQFDTAAKFSEGLASVRIGDRYGYIDQTGEIVIEFKFDYANNFSDGLASVEMGKKHGYVDRRGNILIPPRFDYARDFSEGLALIRVGNLWGFINKKGSIVIRPQFKQASDFSGGLAKVGDSDNYLIFGYINNRGQYVWKSQNSLIKRPLIPK